MRAQLEDFKANKRTLNHERTKLMDKANGQG